MGKWVFSAVALNVCVAVNIENKITLISFCYDSLMLYNIGQVEWKAYPDCII